VKPPVENESVFVLIEEEIMEARVTRRAITYKEFDFVCVEYGPRTGRKLVEDEGVTWCRPEQLDAFRVACAL
jgi:hypothetical protein